MPELYYLLINFRIDNYKKSTKFRGMNAHKLLRTVRKGPSWVRGATAMVILLLPVQVTESYSQTEILRWKDGKPACVTLTFDDGSRNQFEIAVPILDELDMNGTFFINTGNFSGSRYYPSFVGRPIIEILEESASVPTGRSNLLERTSMIRYLREVRNLPEIREYDMYSIGSAIERGRYEQVYKTVDEICSLLRGTGDIYRVIPQDGPAGGSGRTSWEDLKVCADAGHEFACHSISHPHLSAMDRENILYELEGCKKDIEDHLGVKHTLSAECPFGIHDERVMEISYTLFPFLRNRAPEEYMDEILRSGSRVPGPTDKEYIQWQRGPLSDTPYSLMCSWVDTSICYNVWLVLVFHGIEGIGWEALPARTIEDYFNFIKSREDEVWVATFQDAYKYVTERMGSSISETKENDAINISLSSDLDKNIYDLPLSLKTRVPDDWKLVTLQCGNETRRLEVTGEGGSHYVMYSVKPDGRTLSLSKAL
jgi:peptidoglycan/xylan/chitin deacetylase (PgdA/CDA1 family)